MILIANGLLILISVSALRLDVTGGPTLRTFTPILGLMMMATLAQGSVLSNGGVDLSIPATITLAGAVILKAPGGLNASLSKGLLACLVLAVIIGIVNGGLVEILRLNPLVVTLATGSLITGATLLYQGQLNSTTRVPRSLTKWATSNIGDVSFVLVLALFLCLCMVLLLRLTTGGRRLQASSSSREASTLAGLRITLYRMLPWTIAAVLAGTVGVIIAGQVGTPDLTIGDPYLLTPVVAAVLGGVVVTGGPLRPVPVALGALFISLLDFDLQAKGYQVGVSQVAEGLVLGVGLVLVSWLRGPTALKSILTRTGGGHQGTGRSPTTTDPRGASLPTGGLS